MYIRAFSFKFQEGDYQMPKKLAIIFEILFISTLLVLTYVKPSKAYPLDITVTTDKSIYNIGEQVVVSGVLTYNLNPVSGGLVALQINDRLNPYVLRTLPVGTPPSGPWNVEITSAYIGDIEGNPITAIKRGSICYIWVFYDNNYQYNLDITIAFTIYDASQVPLFAHMPTSQSIPPGTGYFVTYTWQIPTNAELGPATIYASAYTVPPQNEGTPYSPEKSSTFSIIKAYAEPSLVGSYSSTFKIANTGTRLGTYNVYVASFYLGSKATSTTSFQVKLVGDINGDGYVNYIDGILLGTAFGSNPQKPNWNPKADLNTDGVINYLDAILLGANWGYSGIP